MKLNGTIRIKGCSNIYKSKFIVLCHIWITAARKAKGRVPGGSSASAAKRMMSPGPLVAEWVNAAGKKTMRARAREKASACRAGRHLRMNVKAGTGRQATGALAQSLY